MLYTENLEQVVFERHHNFEADELVVLSGYLGPNPVLKLETLPFQSKVIYGMYGSEGIRPTLHKSLVSIQENSPPSLNIYYSSIPVHSKCYLWRSNGSIVHALVGSANFSVNGLTTPLREVLAEVPIDTYEELNTYVNFVISKSISCLSAGIKVPIVRILSTDKCLLSLLDRSGEIHTAAGLNWGQNPDNHTRPNDAYIRISVDQIRAFPQMFPPKQEISSMTEGRAHRHNDSVDIIWDDGMTMRGLLEGSVEIDGLTYPKQISSSPIKSQLGIYMRNRLGVPLDQPVTKEHLEAYGRTDVEVKLLEDGVYSFDFSRPVNNQ